MTTESFKKDYPQYADLQGYDLLNAMEDTMIRHQTSESITKQIQPLWKRYKLRWLIYRRIPNWSLERTKNSYEEP